MSAVAQDLRLARRSLARNPAWTAAGVLTLAIGLAGSTLVISLLDQAFLRPLPFSEGEQLVTLYVTSGPEYSPMPYTDFTQFRTALDEVADLAAFLRVFMTVGGDAFAETHQGEMVSGTYFSVLGVQPALGRLIGPQDNAVPGGPPVVVLSEFLWRRQFAADPEILGRQVGLDGEPHQVIGVAPPGFRGPVWPNFETAFWVPATLADRHFAGRDVLSSSAFAIFQTVGRVRPGASLETVQARIDPLDALLSRDREANLYYAETGAPWRVRALPGNYLRLWPGFRDEVAGFLRMLGLMALAVLVVACANMALLLLARSGEWRRELALRQALGAGRLALVRRLATEVAVLLVAGGVAATALVVWLSPFTPRLPMAVPYGLDVVLDLRMLGIGLVVALITGGVCAVPPVWRTLRDPATPVDGGRAVSVAQSWVMDALVIGQVALAMTLVLGCSLLVRSAWRVQQVDLGFHAPAGVSAGIDLPGTDDQDTAATMAVVERLLDGLREAPLVIAASASMGRPLGIHGRVQVRFPDSQAVGPEIDADSDLNRVTADYFETFGIPLRAGRVFSRAEGLRGAPVALVSQALATRHWAGRDPIGRQVRLTSEEVPRTVVGVVGDTAGGDLRLAASPVLYLPLGGDPEGLAFVSARLLDGAPAGSFPLREHVARLAPAVAVAGPTMFAELRRASTREFRLQAELAAGLAAVALVLALVGLYGLMRYLVQRREREIGIRTALGATPRSIVTLVVWRGGRATLIGVGLGVAASLVTNRLLVRFLYEIDLTDPLTVALVALVVLSAAVLTCWGPARTAAGLNPVEALRAE